MEDLRHNWKRTVWNISILAKIEELPNEIEEIGVKLLVITEIKKRVRDIGTGEI